MPQFLRALDLNELTSAHVVRRRSGKSVRLQDLPTARVAVDGDTNDALAILSWRWDVDARTNSSRNVYIACQEAKKQGVRHLLFDKVSVNQQQSDEDMLHERLAFSELYSRLPVIAAYDHVVPGAAAPTATVHGAEVVLGRPFSRIIRRPWIWHEVQLYRANPTRVTYVGYLPDLGCKEDFGFLRMVDALWSSSLCQTVLYTLAGTVGMHHVDDFRFILPQHADLLATAHARMSNNDYLLATALLTGDEDGRINSDQSIQGIAFEHFAIGEGYTPKALPATQDYYTRYDISLAGRVVAKWQTKHKFYPFEELRVWLKVERHAERVIREFLGGPGKPPRARRRPTPAPSQLDGAPALSVVFHERDVL